MAPPTQREERRYSPDRRLYSKKEFVAWYGGTDEWYLAPGEDDPEEDTVDGMTTVKRLLNTNQKPDREKAHKYLADRGVDSFDERERLFRKVVPPPRTPADSKPIEFEPEKYPAAAAALQAGEVQFFTLADSSEAMLAANMAQSYARVAEGDIGIVGEALPLTIYCVDATAHARIGVALARAASAGGGPSSDARLVSLEDEHAGLLEKCAGLPPAVRLEWLRCALMHQALDTTEYAVFIEPATVVDRSGMLGYVVEALCVAAGGDEEADDEESRMRAFAAAPTHSVLSLEKVTPKEVGAGITLLVTSAGEARMLPRSGTDDAVLGLKWHRVLTPPSEGVALEAPEGHAHDTQRVALERLRTKLLHRGAMLKPAEELTISPEELAHLGPLGLYTGAYIEAGSGSGRCFFQMANGGLSTGLVAARSGPSTRAAFDVAVEDVGERWTARGHLEAHLPGRVHYRTLQLGLAPNGPQILADAKIRPKAKAKGAKDGAHPDRNPAIVDPKRKAKLLNFSGPWLETAEKRPLLEREGLWLLPNDEGGGGEGGDEEDEELVIV